MDGVQNEIESQRHMLIGAEPHETDGKNCQKLLQKHTGSFPATYCDSLINDTRCPILNKMGKCLSSMLMTVNLLIRSTMLLSVRTLFF